jgi:signal peptidase (SPase) II
MPVLLISAALFWCLDQGSKRFVGARGSKWSRGGLVRFRTVAHRRKIYEAAAPRLLLVFIWFLAAASTLMLYRSGAAFQSAAGLAGVGAALGGAAGNLRDILRRYAILNFVHIGWWPAFNLADVSIVGGLFLAFFSAQ